MRSPSFASIFFSVVTMLVATTQFVFADEAVRKVFTKVGSSSGFKNICASSSCVPTIVAGFINLILGVIAVALVAYIFYAGYLWMTSGGEGDRVEEAQRVIRNAVIGVFIVGFSFTLANLVTRVVTDTFRPAPPPAPQEEAPATGAPGSPGTPTPAPAPTPYINPTCRRSSCTSACILADRCASLQGQQQFTCETSCYNRCREACALDGAGIPAPASESSGSGSTLLRPDPPASCRNPAGYRTCQSTCESAATARTASITDPTRRSDRRVEEIFLCQDRCTRENCSR